MSLLHCNAGSTAYAIGRARDQAIRLSLAPPPASGPRCPAGGEATVCGLFAVTDDRTGLAVSVEPVLQGRRLSQAMQGRVSV